MLVYGTPDEILTDNGKVFTVRFGPHPVEVLFDLMTSEELAEARSEAVPPAPLFDRFGERTSHITDRFVLTGSTDAYRIWRFRSAKPAIEFPTTEEGWARAWTTFPSMESQPA